MKNKRGFELAELMVIVVIIAIIIVGMFQPIMEARQFNKFSKTKITWWDALWADYRIIPN